MMKNRLQNTTLEREAPPVLTETLLGHHLEFHVLPDLPESADQTLRASIRMGELTSTQLARLDAAVLALIDYILSTQPKE